MKVTISLTVDARVADDLKVFYAKTMQGNELAGSIRSRCVDVAQYGE